jgi:hypothetical protein
MRPETTTPLVVEVRFEWNLGRTKVVWNMHDNAGTTATGFADCHVDAMRDAAAFVEAMAQPRAGSAFTKSDLRVVS